MKQLLFLILTITGAINVAYAQKGLDMLYNFSDKPDYFNNTAFSCYADSNMFYVVGNNVDSESDTIYVERSYIARFSYDGTLQWVYKLQLPYWGNGINGNDCLMKQRNGSYVVGGYGADYDINPNVVVFQPYFYLFDSRGDSLGVKSYNDTVQTRFIASMCSDAQNNIIAAGTIYSSTMTQSSWDHEYYYDSMAIWLVKLDSAGNMKWQKAINWNQTGSMALDKVVLSADGQSYVLSGFSYDKHTNKTKTFLIKTDTSGEIIWENKLPRLYQFGFYGVTNQPSEADIIAAPKGGYYFTSVYGTDSLNVERATYYFGKLNEAGDTIWTKVYMRDTGVLENEGGYRIALSKDGSLIIRGLNGYHTYIPTLFKTDSNGNVLWYREQQRIAHFYPTQFLHTLSVAPNGDILSVGYIQTGFGLPGIYDTVGSISWIVLTDSNGMRYPNDTTLLGLSVTALTNAVQIKVYPNPFAQQITIEGTTPGWQISVTDMTGRQVYTCYAQEGKQVMDLHRLTKGMYLITMYDEKQHMQGAYKVLKE